LISHSFTIDELVIGGSLESLLYAYVTETPIIIDVARRPFELDTVSETLDFTFLGYKGHEKIYSLQLWDRLSFLLSLSGLLLFPNSIENITERQGCLVVVTHNMRKIEVKFNKLKRFDKNFTNFAWLYDWFAVRSGGKHDIDILEDDEYLASKLIFHESKRVGVRSSKDVVAVTFVNVSNMYDVEYSEGYAALKTKRMMTEAGIKGTSKGYGYNRKRVYQPIKIEHLHRDRKEQIIPDMTLGQILDMPIKTEGKLWKITTNLFKRHLIFT